MTELITSSRPRAKTFATALQSGRHACVSVALAIWIFVGFLTLHAAQPAAAPATAATPANGSIAEQAARGDSAAQFKLGMAYLSGQGVAQDPAQAIRWWTQAAT